MVNLRHTEVASQKVNLGVRSHLSSAAASRGFRETGVGASVLAAYAAALPTGFFFFVGLHVLLFRIGLLRARSAYFASLLHDK